MSHGTSLLDNSHSSLVVLAQNRADLSSI
jgi:hypothetical protein